MKKNIIVIGSGFGGLAAASRLLSQGHHVSLFEKRDKAGGRAYLYETGGFKFDGGPTVITAPFMFDDLFTRAGRNREDYIRFIPLDPYYRIFDHNGESFDYRSSHEEMLAEIGKRSPADRQGYSAFLKSTKAIFDKAFTELSDKPFLSVGDMVRVVPDLLRLRSHQSVYTHVSRFIDDEFLQRCFSFHPLLVGGNPFDTTSVYSLIHYLERNWGVHYPEGGTNTVVDALVTLIREQGGDIYLDTEIDKILVEDGRATGIRMKGGGIHRADTVVSNADVAFTYKRLVAPEHRMTYTDKKLDSMKYSMSLFVIYFGTNRRYPDSNLSHHNIILGKRFRGLLDDIFHHKTLSDDFSLYLHVPTKTDPSIAPDGCESFYVLSPVPHLDSKTDWKRQAQPYRDAIMKFLEDNYLPDLRKNIIAEHIISPLHFRDTLNSYKGAAFSFEPILTQSAWFRPHNRSEDVEELYFVGAGTHPGAGLPGVLSSAKITGDLIGRA
ncbi:MAG: phytoene desaturase [Balneolaceae bacterium]